MNNSIHYQFYRYPRNPEKRKNLYLERNSEQGMVQVCGKMYDL